MTNITELTPRRKRHQTTKREIRIRHCQISKWQIDRSLNVTSLQVTHV